MKSVYMVFRLKVNVKGEHTVVLFFFFIPFCKHTLSHHGQPQCTQRITEIII